MSTKTIEVLGKIAVVNLDIHTWTGRKKLRREDIKGMVPPSTLASLGSKRIVDPKRVAIFETLKRRAERMLSSIGIRLLGGYGIPLDRVQEVVSTLGELRQEFLQAKDQFLVQYDNSIENWISEQGEWGDIIRTVVSPRSEVDRQLGFGWQVFQIQSVSGAENTGIEEEMGGLSDQLFAEVSKEATRIFEESFLMKASVKQRAVGQILPIQNKLHGLAFLDPRALVMSNFLDEVMQSMPKTGSVQGRDLSALFGLLVILSSPDKIRQYGQRLLDGESFDNKDLASVYGLFDHIEDDEGEDDDLVATTDAEESVEDDDSESDPATSDIAHQQSTDSDQEVVGWSW